MKPLKPLYYSVYFVMFCIALSATQNANAQSLFVKNKDAASKNVQFSEEFKALPYEEQQKRIQQNRKLSQELGIKVPDDFNQEHLRPTQAPTNSKDRKTVQAIKRQQHYNAMNVKKIKKKKKKKTYTQTPHTTYKSYGKTQRKHTQHSSGSKKKIYRNSGSGNMRMQPYGTAR